MEGLLTPLAPRLDLDDLARDAHHVLGEAEDLWRTLKEDAKTDTKAAVITAYATAIQAAIVAKKALDDE